MKGWLWLALPAVAVVALALWAEPAEATTTCHATGDWCQGYAHVSTATGGPASARCFALRTTNTAPTCTTSGVSSPTNEGTWQMDAGSCITFYFFTSTAGALPPAAPNKMGIWAVVDRSSTVVRTYVSPSVPDPVPSSGASYQFCATSDGTSGGSPRAGTYQFLLQAIKDDGVPSSLNYNIFTSGTATVGSIINFDRGAARARMIVSALDISAYPSGSTFAYGVAGDESMTVTASFSSPHTVGDPGFETMRTGIVDDATLAVGAAGATVDVDSGSLSQGGYVVDSTFPYANSPWVTNLQLVGNAQLTAMRWTIFATSGHGSGIEVVSDSVVIQGTTFNIDSRIAFDADGSGSPDDNVVTRLTNGAGPVVSVLNRGETPHVTFYLKNARSESLTRSMTFATRDATPTTCISHGSVTPSSGVYTLNTAIPTSGCTAAATSAGSPWTLLATNTDQSDTSNTAYSASTLLYLDTHIQVASTLDKDDFPTEDADESFDYFVRDDGMGGDASDTWHGWCHVKSVRKDVEVDTSGSVVSLVLKDPTTATRASLTTDTGSDGWTASLSFLAGTPLGTWPATCTATFNGNTGTDAENAAFGVEGGTPGETVYTGVDPMTLNTAWKEGYRNQTNLVTIYARFLDGTARLDAELELLVTVECDGDAILEDENPTEWGGGIYVLEFPGHDEPGDCLAVVENTVPATMGGAASNAFTIQNATGDLTADLAAHFQSQEEHRENSLELENMNDFDGIGFDGFLYLLVLFGIGAVAWHRGLNKHPAWAGVLLLCILGIITIVLGAFWPVAAQIPPAWTLLGVALWCLLMYGIAGFGFTSGEWQERRNKKDNQEG